MKWMEPHRWDGSGGKAIWCLMDNCAEEPDTNTGAFLGAVGADDSDQRGNEVEIVGRKGVGREVDDPKLEMTQERAGRLARIRKNGALRSGLVGGGLGGGGSVRVNSVHPHSAAKFEFLPFPEIIP